LKLPQIFLIIITVLLCIRFDTSFGNFYSAQHSPPLNMLAPRLELPSLANYAHGYTLDDYFREPEKFGLSQGMVYTDKIGRQLLYTAFERDDGSIFLSLVDVKDYNFRLIATLRPSGLLDDLEIETRTVVRGKERARSAWRGYELFDLAMLFFGKRVTSFAAYLTRRTLLLDNINRVNALTEKGTPIEEAINKTWISKQAARHAFVVASIKARGNPGNYSTVEILYRAASVIFVETSI